jgi:STE24 endopeptidase
MAHELGHYVLNHIYEMIIYFGLIIFIGFAFINWLFKKVIHKYGDKWGVNSIADIGGLPLFIFLFSFYFFIATPVTNNIIRSNEVEADYFGLNTAREPDGFASVAMKLSTYRKINPGKWEEIIFFDHPSGNTRVSTAMKWKAENLKE